MPTRHGTDPHSAFVTHGWRWLTSTPMSAFHPASVPVVVRFASRGPMREETNSWLTRLTLGVKTQHATAAEGHNRLMLTKAIDLSARTKKAVALPIAPGDEKRGRSEEHTSELQSLAYLVCRLLLEKKKKKKHK